MLGGSESGTVASQRGLAAVIGQSNAATEGVFGPGIIGGWVGRVVEIGRAHV